MPCYLSSAHAHFAYDDLVGPYRNFRESCKRAHTFWACKQAILIELVLRLLYAHAQNVIARLQGSLKFYKMDYIVWCCRPFAERKGLVRGGWSRYWIITQTHIPDDVSTYSFKSWSADSAGWTGLKWPCIMWLAQRRACNNVTNLLWGLVTHFSVPKECAINNYWAGLMLWTNCTCL